jgi:hypothetical protein
MAGIKEFFTRLNINAVLILMLGCQESPSRRFELS